MNDTTNTGTEKNGRPAPASVGETLAQARREKGKSLEEVSAAINIRAAQLRAIEEGNFDALPGPTYAVGFIRSYAAHLGLNGAEMVSRFKADTATVQLRPELHFPKPIVESRLPNPLVIGAATVGAVVVMVLWSAFSGGAEENDVAASLLTPPVEDVVIAEDTTAADGVLPVGAPLFAVPESPAEPPPPAPEVTELPEEAPAAVQVEPPPPPVVQPQAPVAVRKSKTRVTLQAAQSTWVQIMNAEEKIIYKGVLRPGDQYHVPDEAGLSMITANAGGLEVYVDGAQIPPLGKQGDIVRGIDLSPRALTRERVRVRR